MCAKTYKFYFLTSAGWIKGTNRLHEQPPEDRPADALFSVQLNSKENEHSLSSSDYAEVTFRTKDLDLLKKPLEAYSIPGEVIDHKVDVSFRRRCQRISEVLVTNCRKPVSKRVLHV